MSIHEQQLKALNQAALAITGELALHKVLQQIVDSVREMTGAQYAALGVPNAEGFLDEFIYSGMSPEDASHIPHLPHGLGLLGAIIQEKKTIRLPALQDDPRSIGFPEGHPPMVPFIGVPIMAGNEMLGNLYLTNKQTSDEFTAVDQELIERFAVHAAVAIQNARLYEEVGRLAIIEERTRIGMDLHDGIIQSIYAVGLMLESTKLSLSDEATEANQLLDQSIAGLNDTIRDIRNYILDLRPRRFEGDLEQGLARLVREFQANTMITVTMDVEPESLNTLPFSVARTIFAVTQEALANIARHARATSVVLTLKRVEMAVTLVIMDNGRGFDPLAKSHTIGHGLSNMQTRAKSLNGTFKIESALGQGATITLSLPFR